MRLAPLGAVLSFASPGSLLRSLNDQRLAPGDEASLAVGSPAVTRGTMERKVRDRQSFPTCAAGLPRRRTTLNWEASLQGLAARRFAMSVLLIQVSPSPTTPAKWDKRDRPYSVEHFAILSGTKSVDRPGTKTHISVCFQCCPTCPAYYGVLSREGGIAGKYRAHASSKSSR